MSMSLTTWALSASSAAVPKVEIYPPQLSLQAGETKKVWVRIFNDTGESLETLELEPKTGRGMQVTVEPFATRTMPAGGEILIPVTVTSSPKEPPSGPLYLVASYRQPSGEKDKSMVFAELKLEARAPSEPSKLASLELSTASRTLDEYGPGFIYLTVRNIADRPIKLDCPEITKPEFIGAKIKVPQECQDEQNKERSLHPGESQNFEVEVKPDNNARAGNHPVLISLALHWYEGGRLIPGTLTASHTVEVGVFGESTVLQLLGIPSFLVLPGFLMLGSWLAIRRWLMGTPVSAAEGTAIPTREFWLIALTLSLVTALIYPHMTGRNYLRGYGLIDVVYVWLGSILVAAIVAFAQFIRPFFMRKYYEPQFEDMPLDALCKAKRSRASLAQVEMDGKPDHYFVYREGANQTWVAPKIKYEFSKGCSEEDKKGFNDKIKECLKKIEKQKPDYDVDKLVRLIREAADTRRIGMWWDSSTSTSAGPICKEGRIGEKGSSVRLTVNHTEPIVEIHEQ
jgi:hypothetical protein